MLHKVEEVEKTPSFYDVLKREWDMHSAGDLVMCFGDFNRHVCWHSDGFHSFMDGMA